MIGLAWGGGMLDGTVLGRLAAVWQFGAIWLRC